MPAQEGDLGIDGLPMYAQEGGVMPAGQADQLRVGCSLRRADCGCGEGGLVLVADEH